MFLGTNLSLAELLYVTHLDPPVKNMGGSHELYVDSNQFKGKLSTHHSPLQNFAAMVNAWF